MKKVILTISIFIFLFALGTGKLKAQVDARLPSNFSLQVNGQVRFSDSKMPAANVLVRIESFTGGLVGQIMTDRTGKFSFNGLKPAQYVVTIHAPGYIDIRENVNLVTSNTSYINALLIKDGSSLISNNKTGIIGPSVIDASVPQAAKDEFQKGKELLDEGKKEKIIKALPHFVKALEIHPQFLDAQLLLGLGYMDLQDWAKAETALKAAIEININAATSYLALGEVYRRQKKYTEAEKILLGGIKVNDSSAEIHNKLAKVYWEMAPAAKSADEFKSALSNSWKEVRRTLELNAKIPEANLLAGNLLLKAGRGKDALGYFEEYLKLEPDGEFAEQTQALVKKLKKVLSEDNKNK